jgi:uncharacterized iron-regulated membrane protein
MPLRSPRRFSAEPRPGRPITSRRYRFDFDDERQTRVYVSTTTGSVTRHTDKQRQFQANAFSTFHKLSFIPNKDMRDLVLTVMTGGIFVASLLGVVLFFLTRPRRARLPNFPQSAIRNPQS